MPELDPNFPREWLEFPNPDDPDELFKCDLTWLTSAWSCTFMNGCQGINKEKPNDGCCSDGAYYTDEADEERTLAAAARLTPQMWQFWEQAAPKRRHGKLKISEVGHDNDRKTRMVEGSCIFLNRPGFSGGEGCVLHHLALKEDVHFAHTKPDVCWQLPMRRSFENREVGQREIQVIVIGEYTRTAWGEGGKDFDWYCTNNSDAHIGKRPVYISNETELRLLMNDQAYEILKSHCDARMQEIAAKRPQVLLTIHPATRAATNS
jgi:hypothetical protein